MVYRKPFTAEQRRRAAQEYRSFRRNLGELRDAFPPRTLSEKAALNLYRDCIADIKAVLVEPDRRVRVEELNESLYRAQIAMTDYLQQWYLGSQGEP